MAVESSKGLESIEQALGACKSIFWVDLRCGGGRNYSSSVHSGGLPQLRTTLQWAVTYTSGPLRRPRNTGDDTSLQWGPELEEAS